MIVVDLILLICIVVDHDVNIAAKQCFLVLMRFTTFLLRVLRINNQLEGVNSAGAAWRSRLLRMEWNRMIRVVWREERLWAEAILLLVSGYYSYVYGCGNQIIFAT
jgi:hypothetical protein